MSAFGRRRVREALAWDYSVAPLLAAYDKALGREPMSGPARQREHAA
jgi:hypothetical protein